MSCAAVLGFGQPATATPLDGCTDEYDQPVAHYTLDPADTSGTTIVDRMGNHNATIYGSVSATSGVINDAMYFNGTNAFLETDNLSELQNELTFSAWVYLLTDPAGQGKSVISKFHPGNGDGTFDLHASNHFKANVRTTSGYLTAPDPTSSSAMVKKWVHVAMTYANGVATLYRDGVQVAQSTGTNAPLFSSSLSTLIGAARDSSGNALPLAALLDEVVIWEKSLDATAIDVAYQRGFNGLEIWDDSQCLPTISAGYSAYSTSPSMGVLADGQETIQVNVYISDPTKVPVSGVTIQVNLGNGATLASSPAPTNAQGQTVVDVVSSTPGLASLSVIADPQGQAVTVSGASEILFRDPNATYWAEWYEFGNLSAPNVIAVFADQTDLGSMIQTPGKPEFDQYDALVEDFETYEFFIGEVAVAPAGGIDATTPLLFFGGESEDIQTVTVASGPSARWAPEFGTFHIPEGDLYIQNFVGGNRPSGAFGCGCNEMHGCAEFEDPAPSGICQTALSCDALDAAPFNHISFGGIGVSCNSLCPSYCIDQDYGFELPDELTSMTCIELNQTFDPPSANERACEVLMGIEHCACRGQSNCVYVGSSDAFESAASPAGNCDVASCDVNSGQTSSQCCAVAFKDYDGLLAAMPPSGVEPHEFLELYTPPEQHMLCLRDSSVGQGVCSSLEASPNDCRTDICSMMPTQPGIYCGDNFYSASASPSANAGLGFESNPAANCIACGAGGAGLGCLPLGPISGWEMEETGNEEGETAADKPKPPAEEAEGKTEKNANKDAKPPAKQDNAADPIALGTGEFFFDNEDLAFESRGVPFSFTRSYRSGGSQSGVLGPGFTHPFDDYIEIVGDRYNRHDAPMYCSERLPTIRCLYRFDAHGGRTLHVFDKASGVFSAVNGGFTTIRGMVDGFLLREPGGVERFYNALGRLESVYDHQGYGVTLDWRIRSVDEVRNEGEHHQYVGSLFDQAIEKFGMYYGQANQLYIHDPQGITERNLMIARLELTRATDSFGREVDFEYESWENGNIIDPVASPRVDNKQRRRRLKRLMFRGEAAVTYNYTWLDSTQDAYLTKVVRTGVTATGLPAAERVVRYEYQWDVLQNVIDLITADTNGNSSGPTTWAAGLAASLIESRALSGHCGNAIVPAVPSANNNDGCTEISIRGSEAYAQLPPLSILDPVKRVIADNIIRVYLADVGDVPDNKPDVETFYDPDPRSIDFDRAVRQRYGATPSTTALDSQVLASDASTVLHTWKSIMPEARLYHAMTGDPASTTANIDTHAAQILIDFPLVNGDISTSAGEAVGMASQPNPDHSGAFFENSRAIPPEVLDAAPAESVVPFQPPGYEEENNCKHLDGHLAYPTFYVREPATTRSDVFDASGNVVTGLPIVRSTETCAAIAARQLDDALRNENVRYFTGQTGQPPYGPKNGQRRDYFEADAQRVCRWVEVNKRDGTSEFHGLNFMGLALVNAVPSPTNMPGATDQWQITLTKYNVDGLPIETYLAEEASGTTPVRLGTLTEIEYGDDNAFGLANNPGGRVLYRASKTKLTVTEAPLTGLGLEQATAFGSANPNGEIHSQTWEYSYEPVFQQLLAVKGPGQTAPTTEYIYDYQQMRRPSATDLKNTLTSGGEDAAIRRAVFSGVPAPLAAGQSCRTTTPPYFDSGIGKPMYCDRDLDGDTTRTISGSGALILTVQRDVDLGGGTVADVGTRFTLDSTGRVIERRAIQDFLDPNLDTNRVFYGYYDSLSDAEAGIYSPTVDGSGPIAQIRAAKGQTVDDPEDAWVNFAYDATSKVRASTYFDDSATTVTTVHDSLGRHHQTTNTLGLSRLSYYDDSGNFVRRRTIDTTDAGFEALVEVHAIGGQRIPLGSCSPLAANACDTFQAFAELVSGEIRAGSPTISALPDASYVIRGYDLDDRPIGSVDAEGGHSRAIRNGAGAVVRSEIETKDGPLATDYVIDRAGNIRTSVVGNELRTHSQLDSLNRIVATQTNTTNATFTPGAGTITFAQFDLEGRKVRTWVEGDDESGTRGALAAQQTDYTPEGIPRFSHQLATTIPAATGAFPTGPTAFTVSAGDAWATSETRYDHALRPIWEQDEGLSSPTTAIYDGLGLTERETADIKQVFNRRPSAGELEIETIQLPGTTPTKKRTEYYDGAGQIVLAEEEDLTITPASQRPVLETIYEYDGIGRLEVMVDPSKRVGQRTYDTYGRLWKVEEISPDLTNVRETTFSYDANGRTIAVHASAGHTTAYDYDLAGRMFKETVGDAFGTTSQIRTETFFDAAGRVSSRERSRSDGAIREFAFSYPAGRAEPTSMTVDLQTSQTWVRDGLGRAVQTTDHNMLDSSDDSGSAAVASRAVQTNQVFDTLGRLTEDRLTVDGIQRGTLDLLWPSSWAGPASINTPSNESIAYTYGANGAPSMVTRTPTSGTAVTASFDYKGGALVGITAALFQSKKIFQNIERSGFGWVMASEVLSGTNSLAREDVLRGPTGRVTASRRAGDHSGLQSKGYEYDHLGRLSQHTYSDGANVPSFNSFVASQGAAQGDEIAGSDAAYATAAPNHVTTTGFNALDNLTSTGSDEHGRQHIATFSANVGGSPPETFANSNVTLDAHFRIIDDGSLAYVHDGLDRFRTALSGSGIEIDAQYDASGRRRVEQRLKPGGASETVYLHYFGPNVIEEIDAANVVVATTTFAPGVDKPLIFAEGPTDAASGSTYVLGRNVRGDVITAVEYASGNLAEEARYSPWGERQYFDGNTSCIEGLGAGNYSEGKSGCEVAYPVLSRFGISGARAHARTKLVDLRARVYATHLKGFLTRDPLGHIDSHGLWNYVAGDPVNFRDPSGMTVKENGGVDDIYMDCDAACWAETPDTGSSTTVTVSRSGMSLVGALAELAARSDREIDRTSGGGGSLVGSFYGQRSKLSRGKSRTITDGLADGAKRNGAEVAEGVAVGALAGVGIAVLLPEAAAAAFVGGILVGIVAGVKKIAEGIDKFLRPGAYNKGDGIADVVTGVGTAVAPAAARTVAKGGGTPGGKGVHHVTPDGTVLPGGKDVDLVPTAKGREGDWMQIHRGHDHKGLNAQSGIGAHTHVPQRNLGPNGASRSRVTRETTAGDIDAADAAIRAGTQRFRRNRKDKGDL